jgi:hypothetical protein
MKAETRKHPAQTEVHIYIQPHAKLNQADNDLIEELAARGYADPYTLRQRLQGMFPAQLLHGSAENMEKAAEILTQHRRAYRSITPMQTLQEPETLKSFTPGNAQVVLHSQSATLCCSAEHTILAIVADISCMLFTISIGMGLWCPWKGRLPPRTATVERPWTAPILNSRVPWNGRHKSLLNACNFFRIT